MDPMARRHTDPLTALAPVVVCSAHAKTGSPCKQPCIPGGTVCRFHGGSAPQVREAARKRLLELVPMALQTLQAMASGASSEAVRVRAAIDLLDRAGLRPADEVVVSTAASTNEDLDAAIIAAMEARGLPAG